MRFFVQSLLDKPRAGLVFSQSQPSQRSVWVAEMKSQLPELEIMESVNGFSRDEVFSEFRKTGLTYHGLAFKNFGVLACWLTKFKGFQMQVEREIEAACWMEDDLELGHCFRTGKFSREFILDSASKFDRSKNILRLGGWGECYVTFLDGAQRLVEKLKTDGIRANVDDQLRGCDEQHMGGLPYRLKCWTNFGDTLKAGGISPEDESALRTPQV